MGVLPVHVLLRPRGLARRRAGPGRHELPPRGGSCHRGGQAAVRAFGDEGEDGKALGHAEGGPRLAKGTHNKIKLKHGYN